MSSHPSKTYDDYWHKPLWEKVLYALFYELCAIVIIAPVAAHIMHQPLTKMGLLTMLNATAAMLWNMLYNSCIDRVIHHFAIVKNYKVRILQSLGFEGGLVFILVPIAATVLHINYLSAFMLDIGFFIFYLPYTYIFGWIYDALREWFITRYLLKTAN